MILKKLSLPFQLIIVIGSILLFGQYLNESVVRACYTFSLVFKEVLGLFLPFIVFAFILGGILSFKRNAPLVLLLLLSAIVVSNLTVATMSFFTGKALLPWLTRGLEDIDLTLNTSITPLFNFKLPSLVGAETAMLCAIIIGLFFSYKKNLHAAQMAHRLKNSVEAILKKLFIPLLPLYVFGFLAKLSYEGTFHLLFQSYGSAFLLIVLVQLCYLIFMYLATAGFNIKEAIRTFNNAIPSYLTAFSTMSSTATIPVTIEGVEKNTGNESLADISIPIMANVHLVGDAITTPILSLVTMSLFFGYIPSFTTYFTFVVYFCMAMLATSGVPGGGIIVVIPLLKSIFGFTPEMVSIITTLYLLQDCLGTAGNVMGDGALTIAIHKLLKFFKIETA